MAGEEWWKTGVIYQIYPRSFQDSNGDGVGDLNGIRRRLAYLADLGVDAVWISPFYKSPMADCGYDVSDYCSIDPVFGTMRDFETLIEEAHAHGLKLILDFVPNHTSDQHPWFLESRSSRKNAKRDWFIWKDARPDGGVPNNWLSNFGGNAWEWDGATGQYYYHAFLKEQPDLNWRNPEVREAMYDAMRFWLSRGVDGFRVDVLWHLMKDPEFRDDPPNPAYTSDQPQKRTLLQINSADHPDVHDVVREMRRVTDAFPERVLIGEIYLPLERLMAYYGRDLSGAHLPFNFQLLRTQWTAEAIAALVAQYEEVLPPGGWPNWVLGNHDYPRIATRVGVERARGAALLLLTLRGTPTMYYGDELGMTDVPVPPEKIQDNWAKREPGINVGRDPERTPMQWDAAPNAGFSKADPWLPLSHDWQRNNVEALGADPGSFLNLYKALLGLRRKSKALRLGSYQHYHCRGDVFGYFRSCDEEGVLILINFGGAPEKVPCEKGTLRLSTLLDRGAERVGSDVSLRPYEGVLIRL